MPKSRRPMPKSRRVYPVEGRWLNDVAHVPHDCTDKRCVESGAFTDRAPELPATESPPDGGPSDSAKE